MSTALPRRGLRRLLASSAVLSCLALLLIPSSPAVAAARAATTAAEQSIYRMNSGGPAVTDSIGRQWRADEYYTGGGTHTVTTTIAGTADQSLFQSERWGMSGYDIPVANGTYTLQLLLAELNPSSGTRIFSVTANGQPVITNYNIAAEVGNFRADVVRQTVTVTGGVLQLRFTASSNSASVTGIELLTTSAPSGQPMPTGDLPGWHQIFSDDFTTPAATGSFPGTAYGSTWNGYDGSRDTSKQGLYSPAKTLSVSGGALTMNLHTENGTHLVAAPYPRLPGGAFGQTYGRYSVRFRADSVAGYKTAWLLWPDTDRWADGEIDFPEGNLTGRIEAFSHHVGAPTQQDQFSTTATYSTWHTATTEWIPGRVTFILDGTTIGTTTTAVPNTSMHFVLQTETCTDGCTVSNTAAGNVQVDWISIYSRS